MTDIFREVDEEVRRDRALQFWKKHQNHFIALAAAVVLATGAWRAYEYWQTRQAEQASARYETALDLARSGDAARARSELQALAAEGPRGYRLLARLRAADEIGKSDPAAAVKEYDAIAADSSAGTSFQEIAKLRAAMLLLDTADFKEIRTRLEPLTNPNAAFRHTARELLALAALKANEGEAAGRWLDAMVVDPETPPDARQRAEALLGLVRGAKPATG